MITLKLLADHATESDRELAQNAEQELHAISLKDHDVSKVVAIIHKRIKTLTANGVITRSLTSDCISALCDNKCCEDCRMDVNFF